MWLKTGPSWGATRADYMYLELEFQTQSRERKQGIVKIQTGDCAHLGLPKAQKWFNPMILAAPDMVTP